MQALKKIGIGIGVLVVLLLLVGLFLPEDSYMQRQIVINAPIETVFEEVNDFKNWEKWSPFVAMDPTIKITYGAETVGKGASYSWDGEETGSGEQFILDSSPNQTIETKVIFIEGDSESMGFGHWQFKSVEDGVEVTWGFSTTATSYFEKYFGVLMDPFLGGIFQDGLESLKKVTEAKALNVSLN
ncbi:SRPBCC family protein [Chondrinema litorale]|uniref:SRPBCC family protein n=1 Tax=Chondrinema litorale TaxID=2994555 RepID=UPI002542D41B|nr:SRPBCC family protein [Chondrinema litorale]UZR92455.1 SRPBCC family protein [Chondrinema litorale]